MVRVKKAGFARHISSVLEKRYIAMMSYITMISSKFAMKTLEDMLEFTLTLFEMDLFWQYRPWLLNEKKTSPRSNCCL